MTKTKIFQPRLSDFANVEFIEFKDGQYDFMITLKANDKVRLFMSFDDDIEDNGGIFLTTGECTTMTLNPCDESCNSNPSMVLNEIKSHDELYCKIIPKRR